MTVPIFTNAAVAVADAAGADTLANFPAVCGPGDLVVAIFLYKSGTSSGITWPGNFTEFQSEDGASGMTVWLAYHLCTGVEGGGTFNIDHASTTTLRLVQTWAFRGVDPAQPLILTSVDLARGTDASVEHDPVISFGLNRLGVAVTAIGGDFTISDFDGEIGGPPDWTIRDYQNTILGSDAAIGMSTVDMPNVATIKSGVATLSSSATWACSTFALKPLTERDTVDQLGTSSVQGHGVW